MSPKEDQHHYSRFAFYFSLFNTALFIFTLFQYQFISQPSFAVSLFISALEKMLGVFLIIALLISIWSILVWEISSRMKWIGAAINTILFVLYMFDGLYHGLLRMVVG